MVEAARKLVLLADRLGPVDAAPIRRKADYLQALGFSVSIVPVAGGSVLGTGEVFESPGLIGRWRCPWAVRRLTSGEGPARPDILHVLGAGMDLAGVAVADRWGVPYVLSIEDYLPPGAKLRLGRTWCRGLIAPTRELAEDLIRSLGVPRSWIAVIPPGLAIGERELSSLPTGRVPVVGAASPLVQGSGLATFLDAARRIIAGGSDVEFVIAGEGPGEADLRRVAERLGVASRVTFAATAGEDSTLWRVLDLFCQTSLMPSAGRGLAMAMAHGVPSIVSDVEGLRSWSEDGRAGLLVPPGESEALARSILTLLADPRGADELGRRGRERIARDLRPEREAAELAALYDRILAAAATAASGADDGPFATPRGLADPTMTRRS